MEELKGRSKGCRQRIDLSVVDLAVAHHMGRRNMTEKKVAHRKGSRRVVDEGGSLTFYISLRLTKF